MYTVKRIAIANRATFRSTVWLDYLNLTKPRVISLLLLTTLCAMLISGQPLTLKTVLLTLLGGYLAAGGAGAINCYLDRDIDSKMLRTRRRPLPAQRLTPIHALIFGVTLSVLAFLILWQGVNLASALLASAGSLTYIFIYTLWLKRTTSQNIVIGGAAGAFPPLVGWAAATGNLSALAWWLFIVIFLWTPPHFWALALVRRHEYARAGVPMLPVTAGERATRNHIFGYTILLVLVTLLPLAFGAFGLLYAISTLLLGGYFIYLSWRLLRAPTTPRIWQLYKFSLLYLALLFVAMAADRILLG
jgi:protoheme IX farnesyltransferase